MMPDKLSSLVERIGYPVCVKTATTGYDGKGQWRIASASDIEPVTRALRESARSCARWIVEALVPFERELSIIAVRGSDGQTEIYPLAENEHEEGILRTTLVPAPVSSDLAARAEGLALQVVEQLQGIGVFCLEFFHLPSGELLINEIAPRPHNSGHYTLDACPVSQFEQQVRALCSLPLGEIRLVSPAAMINLIGDDAIAVAKNPSCLTLVESSGAFLHLYGKRVIRPRRKMGHVTFLASPLSAAHDRAQRLRRGLAGLLTP
jgi:5-(carboxyamino)imidazole ribonucleotide synthase